MTPGEKLVYTRDEAAELLMISVSSVDMMIRRGMLKVARKGRLVLIPKAEVERAARTDMPRIWTAPEKSVSEFGPQLRAAG